ncbi:MAG: hypothetical protein QE271_00195 [Bacteriovoracaceae bacterium]|nr:hypothetical protein [Bacteriovoracaceae bacterium]
MIKKNPFQLIVALLALNLICFNLYSQDHMAPKNTYQIESVFQIDIDSAIGPATYDYLKTSVEQIEKINSKNPTNALLIKMSTPGGLVSTTKQILNLMGETTFPIIVWIGPQGSSATSAGAIISAGAHYLYMSEGTNIGAATPIGIGGDLGPKKNNKEKEEEKVTKSPDSDVRSKAINDLVALTKSLAESKGRDAAAYEMMITQAKSFTAQEALSKNVINGIANEMSDIWPKLLKSSFKIKNQAYSIVIDQPNVSFIKPTLGQQLLTIFTNPEIAYLLFLAGLALLYFEFQAPGGYVAGSFGILALIFAAMGFQFLTINFGGIFLIILSLGLFVVELYLPSFGLLSLAALASLIAGSLILYKTDDSLFELSHFVILSAIAPLILGMGLMIFLLYKTRPKEKIGNFFSILNTHGQVVGELMSESEIHFYQVKVDGQIWRAKTSQVYNIGDLVQVMSKQTSDLTLEIIKKL